MKRLSIESMQHLAESRGGKCLSKIYKGNKTKLLWECSEGHQWNATPSHIKHSTWCPYCAGNTKLSIGQMQEIAKIRNGDCLSSNYVNAITKLQWRCSKGHLWMASPDKIKQGKWCPYCAGKCQTITDMQQLAISRKGKCLSDHYVGSDNPLLWECEAGHVWSARPNNIKTGTWCPFCSGTKKLSLEDMQKAAEAHGGKCLSNTYVGGKSKILWECAQGHRWEAAPISIKNKGSWCPTCAGLQRGTIFEMKNIAEERGGTCLSEKYENNREKLVWECAHKHQWNAAPVKIKSGQWCPECSKGLGERISRDFFEQLFRTNFIKGYPKWLINSRGNQMELDGYCQELCLAFEHHGQQHYSSKRQFINSRKLFLQRKRDDRLKRILCEKNNVVLIELPEIPTLLPLSEIKQFIKSECLRQGVKLPSTFDSTEINLIRAYSNFSLEDALKELKEIAQEKGGKCLSEVYTHSHIKIFWECAEGHKWEATPTHIRTGTWCPFCSGKAKLTIDQLKTIAISRGGKCLSNQYKYGDKALLWECANGHQWESKASNIRAGHWCPICTGTVGLNIQQMKKIAVSRGGKCLSDTYHNSKTKLLWECNNGHQWKATPGKIKQGKWCPYCAGKHLSIDDMRLIANKRGGKCISEEYRNSTAKLLWECANGHQWAALPLNVKRGSWCPECSRRFRKRIK